MTEPARVFIVDDHPLVREGLGAKIEREPGFELCGEAGDAADTLRQLATAQPDIVLVDLSLPHSSGLALLKAIHRNYPHIKLLVVSMHDEAIYGPRARQAGAAGFVSKHTAAGSIITAMQRVMAGESYFDTSLPDFESETTPLTNREFQLFELIGQGMTVAAIAESLNLSVKTVEAHRENIKEKLGIESSHDLTIYATKWFAMSP